MNIESTQDKEYSNTEGTNYSVGGSAGAFGLNFGGGFDKKERNWVDNQTSIIGNNSVVINTKNNTNIKGAVIASGSYEDVDIPETEWTTDITSGETAKTKRVFKDNGNLVLNTGSLTYSDIYDNNTEKNQNLNVGLGTTINFGFSNGGVDIEQTTKATIGNGKITIGGHTLKDNETITQDGTIVAKSEENIGINRDVNNSQEITKNETTGGWNIDVSVNIPELLDLIDKGPKQYTKDQIDKAKENINKVKEKIEQAKNITKEQYENLKNLFSKNISEEIEKTENEITKTKEYILKEGISEEEKKENEEKLKALEEYEAKMKELDKKWKEIEEREIDEYYKSGQYEKILNELNSKELTDTEKQQNFEQMEKNIEDFIKRNENQKNYRFKLYDKEIDENGVITKRFFVIEYNVSGDCKQTIEYNIDGKASIIKIEATKWIPIGISIIDVDGTVNGKIYNYNDKNSNVNIEKDYSWSWWEKGIK